MDTRGFADDSRNPYAPPNAEIGWTPKPEVSEGTAIPFTVRDILSNAYAIFKARMGLCIGIVIGCGALNWAYGIGANVLQTIFSSGGNTKIVVGLAIVGAGGGIIFQAWLWIGQSIALLEVARLREVEFSRVFSGAPYLFRSVIVGIIYTALVLGSTILCLLPAGILMFAMGTDSLITQITFGVGMIVAFFLVIRIVVRVSQVLFVIIDQNMGALESLRISNELTRGKEGTIVALWTVLFFINLAGFLACLVGMIFTVPLTSLVAATAYVAITGGKSHRPSEFGEIDFPDPKPTGDPEFDGLV